MHFNLTDAPSVGEIKIKGPRRGKGHWEQPLWTWTASLSFLFASKSSVKSASN